MHQVAFEASYPHHQRAQLARMNSHLSQVVLKLPDSPLKLLAISLTVTLLGYCAVWGLNHVLTRKGSIHMYPPGPIRRPLIGAIGSYPKNNHPYDRFCEWAMLYGDIVYAPLPGMEVIILNSYEFAQEVLSKRPSSTAGRRIPYIVTELMEYGWMLPFLQPGPSHSNQRKLIRRGIGPQRVGRYDPLVEAETSKLAVELETSQGNPDMVIRSAIGRIVIKATYGQKIWDEMGERLTHWNRELTDLSDETFFGFWSVEFLRFLRFIPDWVPGLRFKEITREAPALAKIVRFKPYNRGLELYKAGILDNCILSDLLEEFGDTGDLRDSTAILFGTAFETTTAAIVALFYNLFLRPEVAQRVFEEIQSVTHGERLPNVADRSSLLYTDAVFKESVRIRSFMPLGVPHVNDEDEIVKGYFIPKGTVIHQNTGYILNDPKIWGDPEVFRPERFLEPEAAQRPNPLTVIFGYGMRICPGMYLADRVAFHVVATVATMFHVAPLEGKEIPKPQSITWSELVIQQPIGFECRFVARNEEARQLLKMVSFAE